jgi:DNA-directed RNA polymerase subunit alpha
MINMTGVEGIRLSVKESEENPNYGEFVVAPLERGFGNTLGNSMRRVLLSSLPGAAASAIKISGVMHEFSAIPGIKEDVTEIVLNIKSLIFKLNNCNKKVVSLNVKGPISATAEMIETDSDVEILNRDLVIATLESGTKLDMEITLNRGIGYVSAEQRRATNRLDLGAIAVDSIFTPVLKVNYNVENTRVGQMTDYDRLTLQVWTNGVLSAKEAVSLAGAELIEHFNFFADLTDLKFVCPLNDQNETLEVNENTALEELGFSVRAYNSLKRSGMNILKDLMKMNSEEISNIRNLGKKSFDEVVEKLKSFGWNSSKDNKEEISDDDSFDQNDEPEEDFGDKDSGEAFDE